jgi:broad specificity phosphatase PhoE
MILLSLRSGSSLEAALAIARHGSSTGSFGDSQPESADLDMNVLLLTRHAESEPNASGLINADPRGRSPLTERGHEQAKTLGREVAREPIDLCVTSEHERAIATADIAVGAKAISRIVLPELNEPDAGSLEGGPSSSYDLHLNRHGIAFPNPGGGESQIEALLRYLEAFAVIEQRPEATVLVVAHGTPIRWMRWAQDLESLRRKAAAFVFSRSGVSFAGRPDRYDKEDARRRRATLGLFLDEQPPPTR